MKNNYNKGGRFNSFVVLDYEESTDVLTCQCKCGYVDKFKKRSAARVKACIYCRGRDCEICGERIPITTQALTCSDDCRKIRLKKRDAERWKKNKLDPKFIEKERIKNEAKRARRRTDPVYAAMCRERERLSNEKQRIKERENPKLRLKRLARSREIWHRSKRYRALPARRARIMLNREQFNRMNRFYYQNATEEQKIKRRNTRSRWYESMRDDPVKYNDYKRCVAQSQAKRRLKIQADQLAQKLKERQ